MEVALQQGGEGAAVGDRRRTELGEAGVVGRSVSFTKGCYTGQELVARIDSRGSKTPRKLRAVLLPDGGSFAAGDAVTIDGREVGVLTSVAGSRGLASVRREVEPPVDATVGAATVRIEPLANGD